MKRLIRLLCLEDIFTLGIQLLKLLHKQEILDKRMILAGNLAGPGFLAGCDNEGNLTSLPQSAMDYYKETFRAFIIEI